MDTDTNICNKIYKIVYNLTESLLTVTSHPRSEIREATLDKIATENGFEPSRFFNCVYRHLTLNPGEEIYTLPIHKNQDSQKWVRKKDSIAPDKLEKLTTEIINNNADYLKCRYMGVHTIDEYFAKVACLEEQTNSEKNY